MTLAWDTETRSFRWWEQGTPFLMSWDWGEGGLAAPLPGHGGEGAALHKLLDTHEELTGANSKFDAHMTRTALGIDVLAPGSKWTVHDVLTQSRLLFGSRRGSHGLDELSTDLLGSDSMEGEEKMEEAYYKLTGRSDMRHDDAYYVTWQNHPELVEWYARDDATHTLQLDRLLRPQVMADAKLAELYKLELKVQTVLYEAEKIGVNIDQEQVNRLDQSYARRDEQARRDWESATGEPIPEGEGSAERLREVLPRVGVQLTERTEKTGELAVNRKALAPFADHPAVRSLLEWRRVNKFRSTYLGPLQKLDDGVVHTNFKQAEAWTGRMAGAQPNLQNLPKRTEKALENDERVRSVFVPRPEFEFYVFDYESIEVKVLAHQLGIPEYKKLVAHGDPHAITAAAAVKVLGIDAKPEHFYKGTPYRWLRDIAKHCTYGIIYGGGGPVIRDTWNKMVTEAWHPEMVIDLDQAKAIRRAITDAIPGFKAFTATPWRGKTYPRGALYEQLLASQEGEFGYVRTLGGRKQWIKLEKAYVALSGLIQGGAADIMKMAAVNVHDALRPHGAYPLLFVHDELVCEAPKGMKDILFPLIEEAMVDAYPLDPGLTVEGAVTDRSYAHV